MGSGRQHSRQGGGQQRDCWLEAVPRGGLLETMLPVCTAPLLNSTQRACAMMAPLNIWLSVAISRTVCSACCTCKR